MAECKKCEGLGTWDCQDCTEESYAFFIGSVCSTCGGALIISCPKCNGTGKVPDED